MKYVICWFERPQGSPIEYELRRIMQLVHRATFLALSATCLLAAGTCEDVAKLSLPQSTITMAAPVAAGSFRPPANFSLRQGLADVKYENTPAFCRVAATMRPSPD